MLLNIKLVEINQNATRYVPVSAIIGGIFLSQILFIFPSAYPAMEGPMGVEFSEIFKITNIQNIGNVLYTEY
jgi:NADH:ubiquinone oxidoreductase subunit 6 (subunit J)